MHQRRTKILVTLGPASDKKDILIELFRKGVDAVRLNFAHGSVEYFEKLVDLIREIERELGIYIPIMGDIQGPTMRIGKTPKRQLSSGQEVYFVNSLETSNINEIPIPQRELFEVLDLGDLVLIDDGKVEIKVTEKGNKIRGVVVRSGEVRSNVTITVRGKEPDLPVISEKDKQYIDFGVKKKLDIFALSFVRTASDIQLLRNYLSKKGYSNAMIASKIETKSAIKNLNEIVKESDMVLVARGDLGMHYSLEKIPLLQKKIIETSLKFGKPTILATQLLESMIYNPVPTRSEISDIHVGIQEGVDVMMLSGETAIGKYPVEAVAWLDRTIREAERNYLPPKVSLEEETIYDKFSLGTLLLAENMNAKIIAYSKEGQTAKRLAKYRPSLPVYVLVQNEVVYKRIKLLYSIHPIVVPKSDIGEAFEEGKKILLERGFIEKGDIIIKTAGLRRMTTDRLEVEIIH